MKLTVYRVFTYLLLPVAFLFCLTILMLLGVIFSNAAALIFIIFSVCIVYYTFSTLRFLTSGIYGNRLLNAATKKRIRLTAIVCIVFGLLSFSQYVTFFIKPVILDDILYRVPRESLKTVNLTAEELAKYIKAFSAFMLTYTVILLIHIAITFEYLKLYSFLFSDYENDADNS